MMELQMERSISYFWKRAGLLCGILLLALLSFAQPSQQIDGGLFYFPPTQSLLTIGGWGPEDWTELQTVWSISGAGWNTMPDLPVGMTHTTAAYDPVNQRLIAMGGVGEDQATWVFDSVTWSKIADSIETDITGGDPEIIFDEMANQFVMYFGTISWGGDPSPSETYILEEGEWVKQDLDPLPPGGLDTCFVYDHARQEGVWFDGSETWIWKNNAWTQKAPANSPSFEFGEFNMVYDSVRQEIIFYAQGETWTWNGDNWTQLNPPNSPTHPERGFFAMGFDETRGTVVIFGGELLVNPDSYEYDYLDDLWEWNGTTWAIYNESEITTWSLY